MHEQHATPAELGGPLQFCQQVRTIGARYRGTYGQEPFRHHFLLISQKNIAVIFHFV